MEEIILQNNVILSGDEKDTNTELILNNDNLAKKTKKVLDNKITDYFNITKKENMMDINV